MSPSHARKGGVRYRYYLSAALVQGAAERAGSVRRVPAADIEALVIRSVREHLQLSQTIDDRSLVNTHVARVDVQSHQLVIKLARQPAANPQKEADDGILHVGWQKTISTRRPEIIVPEGAGPQYARRIRAETRATLITSIARGRRWLDEHLADPTANAESIASRERCSIRKVNMTVSLAFLAPDLVQAAPLCRPNGPSSTTCSAFRHSSAGVRSRTRHSRHVHGACAAVAWAEAWLLESDESHDGTGMSSRRRGVSPREPRGFRGVARASAQPTRLPHST